MALSPGARLGPYEITAQIGVGGMGEVYRATDTNLKRAVAIKVLPDTVADDPERLARFQREAEVLASLNHPNIAAIHGLERTDGTTALVMELVAGPTLADRIAQGPIPVDEALPIAKQIAEGLEAAHEQGTIHRDLKPANIKLRADGAVKILDFGLAKAFTPETRSPSSAVLTDSPTLTNPVGVTGVGVILGTAAYMAPEQAKSKVVTKATDIWAFGGVLYEMLTGRAAFPGEDTTEILAAVVRGEPDWHRLPAATPPAIRMLLRRCLRKDPRQRWQHAADVRIAIEEALSAPADVASGESRRASWRWVFVSGAVALTGAAIGAGSVWLTRPREEPVDVARVLIAPTPADRVGPQSGRPIRPVIAVSPDGRHLVFAGLREGQRHLYLRALDRLEAVLMPGTEGGGSPFFSPDGQWVGFFQPGGAGRSPELKKVSLHGGPAVTICQTPVPYGVSWGSHGRIVFANEQGGGLWYVSEGGGVPEPLTKVDPAKGEFSHRLPQVLPGGEAVLFTIQKASRRFDDTQIVVQSLVTGARKVVVEGGVDARYVPSGHLVYARMGTLMAVRFDLERLEVAGTAIGVLEDVMQDVNARQVNAGTGSAHFTVSNTGTLAYLPGGIEPDTEMAAFWVDRTGAAEPLPLPRRDFINLRLSPDGTRLTLYTQQPFNVWTLDLASGRSSPLTTGGQDAGPLWTPDGQRIVFSSSGTSGPRNLFWMPGDGSGPAQRLTRSDLSQQASSWSPDGKTLAFVQVTAANNYDVWLLSVGNDPPTVQPLLTTPAIEQYPEFSPDGRWLAYVSNDSGRNEVYVRPYPGPGARHIVSTNGGIQPAWSRKGTELFYTEPGGRLPKMIAVDVTLGPTFTAGRPRMLFEGRYATVIPVRGYDVTADGRFLMTQLVERPSDRPITQIVLVQNWVEELKRLVPTN